MCISASYKEKQGEVTGPSPPKAISLHCSPPLFTQHVLMNGYEQIPQGHCKQKGGRGGLVHIGIIVSGRGETLTYPRDSCCGTVTVKCGFCFTECMSVNMVTFTFLMTRAYTHRANAVEQAVALSRAWEAVLLTQERGCVPGT